MKRFVAVFSVFSIGLFFLPSLFPALAQVCPPGYESLCSLNLESNKNFFGNIVQILIVVGIVLAVLFLIWGGIRWIMSGGDKGKVDQARATITASIVGLIISLLAYFIVSLVLYMLTGNGDLGSLPIPKLTD